MGRPRLDLQALLKTFVQNVYFQPPNSTQMTYPCIVYERDDVNAQHADNVPYRKDSRYLVTVIDRDPDSAIAKAVEALPLCSFNRSFTADNLNHIVYALFF